jgi:nucleotidyltransferase/DNA polymerase involved in DNA repair
MLTLARTSTKAASIGATPLIAALCFDPLPLYLAQRADPALSHAALVCVEDGRVRHASAVAHRLGVTPGMRLSGARMRVAGLQVVESSEPDVEHAWETLLRELYDVTPWLETGRRGRLFARLGAGEAVALAKHYGTRVGVAAAREVAELAAVSTRPGECRTVAPDGEADFLARLPLRFLKAVGISGKNLTRLHWLGLTTVGELAGWNASQLRSYLADEGEALLPYLHGPYRTRLRPERPPEALRRSVTFEEPAREPRELLPALDRLSTALERALGGRAARRLTLTAGLDGVQRSATRLSKRPLARAPQIRQQALFALQDSGAARTGIERLTVELAEPRRLGLQGGLWRSREQRQRALEAALGRYPGAMVQFAWRDPYAEADDLAWHWERLMAAPTGPDERAGAARLPAPLFPAGLAPAAGEHRHLVRAAAVPLFAGLARGDDVPDGAPAAPSPTPPLLSPIPEERHAHAHAPRPRHAPRPATQPGELARTRT